MCMKDKTEVEACKSIIQCFNGTLNKWWEVISSPIMIAKMEAEILRDEQGDVVYHIDGTPHNNMIGALTTTILEHWCGTEAELADKHELILMNMKCRKMSEYEEFRKDWTQRIFEVQDSQNLSVGFVAKLDTFHIIVQKIKHQGCQKENILKKKLKKLRLANN